MHRASLFSSGAIGCIRHALEQSHVQLPWRDNMPCTMIRTMITGTVNCALLMLLSTSSVPQTLLPGDPSLGQLLFNNACRTCHTTNKGDNRLGPNLYKIVGRKAGSLPNYSYSSAMKSADFVWNEAKLDRFIANPDEVVPGNNMKPYGGLVSASDRAKIVAFLLSLADGQ